MNWYESYFEGNSADLSSITIAAPDWALNLRWSGLGMWVTIDLKALKKVIPGLSIYSVTQEPAKFCVLEAPEYAYYSKHAFLKLEEAGFPFIALAEHAFVECEQALLSRGIAGTTDLVGDFFLVTGTPTYPGTIKYKLPKRMEVVTPPGSCVLQSRSVVVKGFRVEANVTGHYPDVHPHPSVMSRQDWLQEVEEEEEPSLRQTIVSTASSRAKSFSKSFFKH